MANGSVLFIALGALTEGWGGKRSGARWCRVAAGDHEGAAAPAFSVCQRFIVTVTFPAWEEERGQEQHRVKAILPGFRT